MICGQLARNVRRAIVGHEDASRLQCRRRRTRRVGDFRKQPIPPPETSRSSDGLVLHEGVYESNRAREIQKSIAGRFEASTFSVASGQHDSLDGGVPPHSSKSKKKDHPTDWVEVPAPAARIFLTLSVGSEILGQVSKTPTQTCCRQLSRTPAQPPERRAFFFQERHPLPELPSTFCLSTVNLSTFTFSLSFSLPLHFFLFHSSHSLPSYSLRLSPSASCFGKLITMK